ncbi:MAG: hypothetical protein D6788_09770 [Planctomycetota bacterium]|nr:MAG: hypothetical protein D6788_09770 [Planctomycetota bacterium]
MPSVRIGGTTLTLSGVDFMVLGGYGLAVLVIGILFGRGSRSTFDYFLGSRRQHWVIVGLSIIATEVSALTYVNVPADAFHGACTYLQMYACSFLGRILIVYLLLPSFYGGSVTTVYEYLGQRFGPCTRTTASVLFILSRILGSAFRLLAASLAVSAVFAWPLEWIIIGCAAVAVAYTLFGGIRAILWTDALQAIVFIGAGFAAVVYLLWETPGPWTANINALHEAGKIHVFTWSRDPNNDRAFWVLTVHATILTMASMGTDQDLTQRMLTCPDLRRGQRSLLFNAIIGLPVVCLFLLLGSLLWSYVQQTAPPAIEASIPQRNDLILPFFIANIFPAGSGLRGLMVAGLAAAAMSSLDSALGALSSTVVTDFYRPFQERKRAHARQTDPEREERRLLRVSRFCTLTAGIILAAVTLALARYDRLLWEVFRWASLIFGGMLGIFLLGVTTKRRGRDAFNPVAMGSSVLLLAGIKFYQEHTGTVWIAWPWWVVIGTVWTYVLAVFFPSVHRKRI